MLSSFINKYLKKKQAADHQNKMQAACSDLESCCTPSNCLGLSTVNATIAPPPTTTTTSSRTSRSNFVKTTTSSVFPGTQFTNPESLPPLSEALSTFTQAYPHYTDTRQADDIRHRHYPHLAHHVCLDYTGFSLFSHSQSQPSFSVSYKSASLASQVQYGNSGSGMESAIRDRIFRFLNMSQEDYTMVLTANSTSAFKLLAEAYPFHSNKRLLTVYDYESESVSTMAESAHRRGAQVMSAEFSWPGLRIRSVRLKRALEGKRKTTKRKGLFVLPLQSRMTGASYPYLWMRMAHENGWDVVLDACALGPKDLDTLGLLLIQPDFVVCSFFRVFGEDPSGFAALLVKKSSGSVLESSMVATSIGIVSIVPTTDDYSGTFSDVDNTRSFSGPLKKNTAVVGDTDVPSSFTSQPCASSSMAKAKENVFERTVAESEIIELESNGLISTSQTKSAAAEIECVGLDHADSLGLLLISSRLRYITNWLVLALAKLRHPNSENSRPLVRIYGPRIKFERGPAIAFNVFDWKGEKIEPALVQKLADRSNISLSCGFLRNIWFSDKYAEERDGVLERRRICSKRDKGREEIDVGIAVVNASLSFLANFEDAYKLWSFVARFLDADFVEKEKWRYLALNQKMIEV